MEVDREKQQEELRNALLAAADEEGAAIVEQARRDITLAVRRARRDLHLIRAQLHLCGLEVPPLSLTQPVERDASSLDEGVPQDAIVVGRTHALRHVVTEASLELAQLSSGVVALTPADNTVTDRSGESSPAPPATRSWSLIAACVLVPLVAGVAGWIYTHQDARPAPLTLPGSLGDAARGPTSGPPAAVPDDARVFQAASSR